MSIQASNGQMLPDREGGSTLLHLGLQSLHDWELALQIIFVTYKNVHSLLFCPATVLVIQYLYVKDYKGSIWNLLRCNFTNNSAEENCIKLTGIFSTV